MFHGCGRYSFACEPADRGSAPRTASATLRSEVCRQRTCKAAALLELLTPAYGQASETCSKWVRNSCCNRDFAFAAHPCLYRSHAATSELFDLAHVGARAQGGVTPALTLVTRRTMDVQQQLLYRGACKNTKTQSIYARLLAHHWFPAYL